MAKNSQFHDLMVALSGAEALVMEPTAESLEQAAGRIDEARGLLSAAMADGNPAAALGLISRLRALSAQAERFFQGMASLSSGRDEGTWNYGQNGKPGEMPARAEMVLHG